MIYKLINCLYHQLMASNIVKTYQDKYCKFFHFRHLGDIWWASLR